MNHHRKEAELNIEAAEDLVNNFSEDQLLQLAVISSLLYIGDQVEKVMEALQSMDNELNHIANS